MAFPRELLSNLGVPLISKLLDGVKTTVTWKPWTGDDGRGNDQYDPAQVHQLRCFVSKKSKLIRTSTGRLATVMATLQFVDPIPAVVTSSVRTTPVDPRDRFILDDGQTAPVVDMGGFNDPVTEQPFAPKVMLGTVTHGS